MRNTTTADAPRVTAATAADAATDAPAPDAEAPVATKRAKRTKPATKRTKPAPVAEAPVAEAPVAPVDTSGFRLARERYAGASGLLRSRSGGKPSPIMHPGKPCNGISDRTRAGLLDLADNLGAAAFNVGNIDAGIIGFLLHLGYAEHVAGTGDRLDKPAPSGRFYVARGAYRLSASGLAYAKRAGVEPAAAPTDAVRPLLYLPDAG